MQILLHVCCAPCLASAGETVRRERSGEFPDVAGIFFYNPNIHPLLEFRRRVKALRLYLERYPLSAEIDDEYGLQAYLAHVPWRGERRERCYGCYLMRLRKTAEAAREKTLAGFSTTLLASREQDRDLVVKAGREAAAAAGVEFFEADLRRIVADEKILRGIYKQQYCGCVFSEAERFRDTARHLYPHGE